MPGLFDVGVGHAGEVVGDGAGEAVGGGEGLMVVGEHCGVGEHGAKEVGDDLVGVLVLGEHDGGLVEAAEEEGFGEAAALFHGRAEMGEAMGGLADVGEGLDAKGLDFRGDGAHEVGDESVHHALESLVGEEAGGGGGELGEGGGVELGEEVNFCDELGEVEDFGFEAVFHVGGEVGDFVDDVDELGFERRELAEEVGGELGVGGGGVVAGVLDDALADAEGEVEAGEAGVAVLKAGDDAEGVEVVVEAEGVGAEGFVEGLFAGVAEGGVADVVDKSEGFRELGVEAEDLGGGAGDLSDFERVGEAAADVVAFRRAAGEDLGFASEAAKGAGVEDAGVVAREGCAVGMGRLGVFTRSEGVGVVAGDGEGGGKQEAGVAKVRHGVVAPLAKARTFRVNRIARGDGGIGAKGS